MHGPGVDMEEIHEPLSVASVARLMWLTFSQTHARAFARLCQTLFKVWMEPTMRIALLLIGVRI